MADVDFATPPCSQEVVITRIINAPRAQVFKMVTDPMLIPEWWGPARFITKVIRMQVMPGGTWQYLQRDPQGKEYGFHGVYHEVVIPERLVYTSEFEGTPGNVTLYTDKFEERDGKTIMTTRAVFSSVEDRDQKLQWGMKDGTIEMTNRLNELALKARSPQGKDETMELQDENTGCITLTRIFDAPRERVWERWTEPGQYMCWWGPKGFTSPYAKFDLRPGGKYLSCMRGPDGKEYWDTGTYEEIKKLERLVYTDSFADEHGNIVPASYYGMGSDKPMDMAVDVTFEDIGGRTRMTLEHCGIPKGDMLDQARTGWDQSFDKLADCLE